MGARRFAPREILNWADGRCLRAAVYIYFILGGMNSASNTFFWWKAALFLWVNLKSFRRILSMCTFQRLPLILDQVIVFFLFYKSPNGPPLQSVCDCLKGLCYSKQFEVSNVGFADTDRLQRSKANSGGETWKLEVVSTAKNVSHSITTPPPPTHQQGGNPSLTQVCEGPIIFPYSDMQMDNQKKQLLWWVVDGYRGDGTNGF